MPLTVDMVYSTTNSKDWTLTDPSGRDPEKDDQSTTLDRNVDLFNGTSI